MTFVIYQLRIVFFGFVATGIKVGLFAGRPKVRVDRFGSD